MTLLEEFEALCKYIREVTGSDLVCGLCEYDAGTVGEEPTECPGFDSDECFKLKESLRKRYEMYDQVTRCKDCRYGVDYYHEGDCYCLNPKRGLEYFGGSWNFYCADAERREENEAD